MTIIGVYWVDEMEYRQDPSDRTYERMAAFDTEKGVWLASSDGRTTDDFEPEDLIDASADDVLDIFASQYDGSRGFHVSREEDVPGTVEVLEPAVKPEVGIIAEDSETES